MSIYQLDIKTAFLNSEIDKEIYITLPKNTTTFDGYYKLKKSLYGLKQAPLYWYRMFSESLVNIGFNRTELDQNVYIKYMDFNQVIIAVYVDDILIMSENLIMIKKIKNIILKEYHATDFGNVSKFLGLEINRSIEKHITIIS